MSSSPCDSSPRHLKRLKRSQLHYERLKDVRGTQKFVELLLTGFSCRDLWEAVLKSLEVAGKNGDLDTLKVLIGEAGIEFRYYSNRLIELYDAVRNVFDEAAKKGKLEVVKFIVQHAQEHRYGNHLTYYSRGSLALSYAIAGGHLNVAEFLLVLDNLRWNIEVAFTEAVEMKQNELADTICEVDQLFSRRTLFFLLARAGQAKAVEYLYSSVQQETQLVADAFVIAAGRGNSAVIAFLLGAADIAADTFDNAMENAGNRNGGFLETVTFLYNQRRASAGTISEVYATTESYEVIEFLHENQRIPDEATPLSGFQEGF